MADQTRSLTSIFAITEVRSVILAVVGAGIVSWTSNFMQAREADAVIAERVGTHERRLTSLEDVTASIARAQASQAESAASVAATQQAMARVLERTDGDIRELRQRVEKQGGKR